MLREKHYKNIVHEVEQGILDGKYKIGDKIPSINFWRIKTGLSRSSVVLAMAELKNRGLIEAEQSVGYFVSSTRVEIIYRYLMVFNEFNSFKQDLYYSILQSLGPGVQVDIVFHHFNRYTFDMLMEREAGKYNVYMIMSNTFEDIDSQLKKLGGRVILIDHCSDSMKGLYPSVTQDFEKDTYDALVSGLQQFRKYREIVLVQSNPKEPMVRYEGIQRFCRDYGFESGFLKTMEGLPVRPGVVYITPEEREIVKIAQTASRQKLRSGVDYGLVAFNDQVMNEILLDGLTTLSTDFVQMGKTAVSLVKEKELLTVRNPFKLILRSSL